jgi:ribosomal protein S18 acetylase RimI-like enzyme
MNLLLYRLGAIDDLSQIKELANASYGQYATILTPENWNRLNASINDDKTFSELLEHSATFVCTDNEKVVGMAFLIPSGNGNDVFQDDWSYIRMVGVHPEYTGRGIAKKLTALCIQKAKYLQEKTIALHTSEFMDAARHVYEQIGFKVVKEIPPRLGKRYWLYTLDIS